MISSVCCCFLLFNMLADEEQYNFAKCLLYKILNDDKLLSTL